MLNVKTEHNGDNDTQRDRDERKRQVETTQVRLRPLSNPGGDFLSSLRPGILSVDPPVQADGHADGADAR